MDRSKFKMLVVAITLTTSVYVTSCKSKTQDTTTSADTTVAPATNAPAPVTIAADDPLSSGVKDATKDYPGVKTQVNNGEITLTGEIQRNRLPALMQTLNSLRPKKINNQLTIK